MTTGTAGARWLVELHIGDLSDDFLIFDNEADAMCAKFKYEGVAFFRQGDIYEVGAVR